MSAIAKFVVGAAAVDASFGCYAAGWNFAGILLECATTCAGRFAFDRLDKRNMAKEARLCGWKIVKGDWLCVVCKKSTALAAAGGKE